MIETNSLKKIEAFKPTNQILETLIEYSPIGYMILDYEYKVQYVNRRYADMRKIPKEKIMRENLYHLLHDHTYENELIADAIKLQRKTYMTKKFKMQNGKVHYCDFYAIPIQDKEHTHNYIMEIVVDRTNERIAQSKIRYDFEEMISIFTLLLEAKDTYTADHSHNVRLLALRLAQTMGLQDGDIFEISLAASLHDIGKLSIPYAIINKPGALTDEEYALIKQHPIMSYNFLKGLLSFHNIQKIVRAHHERVDGYGYPDHLKGDQIPLGAKIVAVADTYDAITSTRSYHQAASHDEALSEIKRVAGKQLDEHVVNAFLQMNFKQLDDEQFNEQILKDQLNMEIVIKDKRKRDNMNYDMIKFDAEPMMNLIMENTPCGYIFVDRHFKIQYANDFYLAFGGYERDHVIGRTCFKVHKVGNEHCVQCSVASAMKSGLLSYTQKEINMSSGLRIFDLFGVPILDDAKHVEYVIGIIIDRTSEVLAQRDMKHDFDQLVYLLSHIEKNIEASLKEEMVLDQYQELKEHLLSLLSSHIDHMTIL